MEDTTMSVLRLEWKRREGGGGKTQRDYLDFIVDGQPLSEKIAGDLVSCLGWFVTEQNAKAVRMLALQEPSDLPDYRYSLYVCPECGDFDCGAVTVIIERDGDKFIWRDFAFQSGYDANAHLEGLNNIGSFTFDRAQYREALRTALK